MKRIVYPERCPISVTARELCAKLFEPSEENRYKYDDVVRDPWIIANTGGKWLTSNDTFLYTF